MRRTNWQDALAAKISGEPLIKDWVLWCIAFELDAAAAAKLFIEVLSWRYVGQDEEALSLLLRTQIAAFHVSSMHV